MTTDKSKQISIFMVLAVSFVIQYPLRVAISSLSVFLQPIAHIIPNIVFNIALFVCFLIVLKPDITLNSVLKAGCIAVLFFVLERMASRLLISTIISFIFQIVKPILIFAVVALANKWLFKSKLRFNKPVWIILGAVYSLEVLFNFLTFLRLTAILYNLGDSIFSYMSLMSFDIFSLMSSLCFYIITFVLFTQNNALLCRK